MFVNRVVMASRGYIFQFSKLISSNNVISISTRGRLELPLSIISVRTAKHWDPKWKWFRTKKEFYRPLPDYHESFKIKSERVRTKLKEMGIDAPSFYKSRPFTVTSAVEIMDPYKPSEGEGKTSWLSKNWKEELTDKAKNIKNSTMAAVRKIKSYESNFSKDVFLQEAHDLYVKAHEVLMNKDPDEMSEYVTEKALSEMLKNIEYKTIRWRFIESLEPPVFVQARVQPVLLDTNLYAQITVRFHTKQSLAIYDRFGRLMYGSEILAKDVLEYIVFEKNINNMYGRWRLHAKIIPDWAPPREPMQRTYREEQKKEEQKVNVQKVEDSTEKVETAT